MPQADRVRAILIQDNLVLLIHRVKNGQTYWVFPGGGVEEQDTSPEATIKRECREELSLDIEVESGELLRTTRKNEISSFYQCGVVAGQLGYGDGLEFDNPERGTYVFAWIPTAQIAKLENVFPHEVRDYVALHFGHHDSN